MQRLNPILSLVFMLLALAAAFVLDRWVLVQRESFSSSFEPRPLLMALVGAALLLVAAWTLLAWWTIVHGNHWFVSLSFILTGLAVLLFPPLRMLPPWEPLTRLRFFYELVSRLPYTGAFIAVLGVLSWILAEKKRRH